jgi:hypothetical protein
MFYELCSMKDCFYEQEMKRVTCHRMLKYNTIFKHIIQFLHFVMRIICIDTQGDYNEN